jgi:hypothetical protein
MPSGEPILTAPRPSQLTQDGLETGRRTEHEVDRAEETKHRPEIVELERLPHVQDGKGDEDPQRDDLLQHLELPEGELGIADPVGRHLQQVLEEAIPQLTSAAMYQGRSARFLR